jgi:signal transduction histidine kinase
MGLDLMRERVAELDGELQLDSTPGEGTTVRITLGPTL